MDDKTAQLNGDYSSRLDELRRELEVAKEVSRKKTRTLVFFCCLPSHSPAVDLEVAHNEAMTARSVHAEALAQKDAELQQASAQYHREMEKLQQSVASMVHGVGSGHSAQLTQYTLHSSHSATVHIRLIP